MPKPPAWQPIAWPGKTARNRIPFNCDRHDFPLDSASVSSFGGPGESVISVEQPGSFPSTNGENAVSQDDVIIAELGPPVASGVGGLGPPLTAKDLVSRRRPRIFLPAVLLVLTCLSTFWVGATGWEPDRYMGSEDGIAARMAIVAHWDRGLIYMVCILSILMAHEMGHYVATLIYRVPASLPLFLPMPIMFTGTMGAVIAMDGRQADRKEIFDIGLAGPIAGLIVAIPVLWIGVLRLNLDQAPDHGFGAQVPTQYALQTPPAINLMLERLQPKGYVPSGSMWQGVELRPHHLNPFLMAGWMGMLVTGLNMLPVGQLDGGHVLYTLFGPRARVLARTFVFVTIAFVVIQQAYMWLLMLVLVVLIGIDHPETADDSVPIGWFRKVLGYASFVIPVLCFTPNPIVFLTGLR